MRVLYVVGSCLTKNTSANMSHNAYVQGLLENGCDVDILMAKDSWGQQDSKLPTWKLARYYCYRSNAPHDKFRTWARNLLPSQTMDNGSCAGSSISSAQKVPQKGTSVEHGVSARVRSGIKRLYYYFFPVDPLYPLNRYWLKNASRFKSSSVYDLVVSNSSPAASHKLVQLLLQSKRLSCKRWIQIWEDPWYADLYSSRKPDIYQEEHALLTAADEIYYVSPLTLKYQKELFPDCGKKMKHIPLPYLDFAEEEGSPKMSFGYFGDYYSHTRNLLPFYQALQDSGCVGSIYGDSDLNLESSERITVSGRVTLDVLSSVQAETGVLVHLCNLRGGQIPGKIYHYSATKKPILFILDGTEEEQRIIHSYFSRFNRYYFCQNTTGSIMRAMKQICSDSCEGDLVFLPVEEFRPQTIVKLLLK